MSNYLNTKDTKGTKEEYFWGSSVSSRTRSQIAQIKKCICQSLKPDACPLKTVEPLLVSVMLVVGNF